MWCFDSIGMRREGFPGGGGGNIMYTIYTRHPVDCQVGLVHVFISHDTDDSGEYEQPGAGSEPLERHWRRFISSLVCAMHSKKN